MEFTAAREPKPNHLICRCRTARSARFRFEESPVSGSGLGRRNIPIFKTYRAQGIDDPAATARFDWLPTGFHAIILSPSGTVLIDPYASGQHDQLHYLLEKRRSESGRQVSCATSRIPNCPTYRTGGLAPAVTSGTQLRTYRLALACTVEYATAVGGNTVAGALAAEVLIMNRVNGVYERDVAIHMNIVANNNLIIYAADNLSCGGPCTGLRTIPIPTMMAGPCSVKTKPTSMRSSVQPTTISATFSAPAAAASRSWLFLAVAARPAASRDLPIQSAIAFAIDYVAHEMGHQWGANHTFNGTAGSCGGGNRSAGSAYEPGSGITIMAYAGICGNNDLAAHSIDTFHVKSLEAIVAYSQTGNGNTCAVTTATGNTPPTVTGPATLHHSEEYPVHSDRVATDPNGDTLTYDWEEYDLGRRAPPRLPNTDSDGSARPIFRPYPPPSGGTRTFPALQYILNNANVPPTFTSGFLTGELLPAISRTMTFQVVARDNRANGGGINTATTSVTIDGAATPFAVLSPNDAISLQRLTK